VGEIEKACEFQKDSSGKRTWAGQNAFGVPVTAAHKAPNKYHYREKNREYSRLKKGNNWAYQGYPSGKAIFR